MQVNLKTIMLCLILEVYIIILLPLLALFDSRIKCMKEHLEMMSRCLSSML